jgi:hypothetical protein
MDCWEPHADQPLGPKELLGRRIFSDRIWDGDLDQGQKRLYRVDHFFDDQASADLSIDRMGERGADDMVVAKLAILARTEAAKRSPPRPFPGWAACSRDRMTNKNYTLEVRATPLADGSNPYHAELLRDKYRHERSALWAFAAMARDIFAKHGRFVNSPPEREVRPRQPSDTSASLHLDEPSESDVGAAPTKLITEPDTRPIRVVPLSLVTRMADRLWRLGSNSRRAAYVNRAHRRLAEGSKCRSDVATVLAAKMNNYW